MNKVLLGRVVVLVLTGICYSGMAEQRVWTDTSGKTMEAEYVRTTGDQVVLRKQDGSEFKVSLDTLSMRDRKYAVLQAPPHVEIKVSTNTDRENEGYGSGRGSGFQVQTESVQCTVSIRKTSSVPYEAPLVSEVYLIGQPEQKEMYVILDRTVSKFKFSVENKNQHSYESGTINLKQVEAGKQTGVEYKGYIAVVKDRTDSVISMKCSKLIFEKNAELILGSQRGTAFDEAFNLVDRAEKKARDQSRKTAKKRFPGRRF